MDLITKPQGQAPHDNLNNPSSTIEGKTVHNNPSTDINDSSSIHNHLCKPSNFSTGSNSKFMYDPGRNYINTKDTSTCDDGDSTSTSSDIASCTSDLYHNLDRNCNKTTFSFPNIDPASRFMQDAVLNITSLHSTNNHPPTILLSNAVQHLPSLQCLVHTFNFDCT